MVLEKLCLAWWKNCDEQNLYHYADLLCQCRAASWPHLYDGDCGHVGALLSRRRLRRVLSHRHRRARRQDRPSGGRERDSSPRSTRTESAACFVPRWDTCGIAYDHFIRTTDAYHMRVRAGISCSRFTMPAISISASMAAFTASAASGSTPRRSCVDGKCPDHQTAPDLIERRELFLSHEQIPATID